MRHLLTRAFFLVLMCATFSTFAFAQAGGATAEIKGKTTDPNGATVSGVSITVTDAEKGFSRTVTSDAQGEYRLLSLPPGSYQIKVEIQGFATQVLNGVQVTVGQIANLDFVLQIGSVTQTVNISAETPVIETERTQQSNTINEQAIRNLPIDRRDYLSYTLLAPGVVDSNALADNADFRVAQTPQSGLSFYGSNGRGNNITVDGAEANEANGGVRPNLSQDAVQEFQVNRSNYNAELGGASGGVINIVSKSGGNSFHGSVFGFFRHQSLDAGDPFAIVLNETANTAQRIKPDANRQQYGGSVGFPIKKDKTFLFFAYEGLRKRESSTVPVLTNLNIFQPTAAQNALFTSMTSNPNQTPGTCLRAGIPNVSLPANNDALTPAQCVPFLRAALTTHTPTQTLFRNNSGVFPFSANQNAFSVRLDHNPSETNAFFLRYNFTKGDEGNQSTRALLGFSRSNNTDTLDHTIVGGWTHIFSPTLINEARIQWNYRRYDVIPNDPNGPELNVPGFGFFNRDIFLPSLSIERREEFADNLSYSVGNHKFKFGANLLIHNSTFDSDTFFSGRFGFGTVPASLAGLYVSPYLSATTLNGIQGLDLGIPLSYQQGFGPDLPGKGIVKSTLPYYAFYAQDTWNIRSNLTFNYGLRYEYDKRLDPLPSYKKNFAPRIGIAWDPFNDKKTSVRAGYGIFYSPIPIVIDYVVNALNEFGGSSGFRQIPQVLTTAGTGATSSNNIFRTLLAQGRIGIPNTVRTITPADLAQFGLVASQTGPRNPLSVVFRADPTYRNPMAQQASLAFDRELGAGLSISASYTWVLTHHITRARDINLLQPPINTDPNVGPIGIRQWRGPQCAPSTLCFRTPTLFQEILYESAASAVYNGGIIEVNKRFGNNFSFSANYTFSKAIDQVTDYNSDFRGMDQTDEAAERALSAFDQRHKFVAYAVIQSPYKNPVFADWTLTPIFRANSGRPFNLLAGVDVNGDRSTNGDRAPLVGRNTGLGPNFWTFDMRLARQIKLGESKSLELTFEAFNLFNRLNFSSINNFVGGGMPCPGPTTTLFGPCNPDLANGFRVKGRNDRSPSQALGFTSAFDPRRIQLGARFRF